MRTRNELIKSWIDKAEKDLLTAQHESTFEDGVIENICFHSQQAVEKFIKAYLIYLEIPFSKTHEIGELITKCEIKDPQIQELKEEADQLTDYAVEVRYPDGWFEVLLEDSQQAIKIAEKIKKYVLDKIKIDVVDKDDNLENELKTQS